MNVEQRDDALSFTGIPAYVARLLQGLPDRAIPYTSPSRARLYPALTGGHDPRADAAWRKRIEKKLTLALEEDRALVERDLRTLVRRGDEYDLEIPHRHAAAWARLITQVRLVTVARLGMTPEDLDGEPPDEDRAKSEAKWQLDFFAGLLSVVLPVADFRQRIPAHATGSVATSPAATSGARLIVLDDAVNLMNYVTQVLMALFDFPEAQAERHMREVHEQGRSFVWSGDRATAEFYAEQLHIFLLGATLEPN